MKTKSLILLMAITMMPFMFSACACLCATRENGGPVCNPNAKYMREHYWDRMGGAK